MTRIGLASAQLERGHVYRCTAPLALAEGAPIKIASIGRRHVRYRRWRDGLEVNRRPKWGNIHTHPRALFDSWDGWWFEVSDPSL